MEYLNFDRYSSLVIKLEDGHWTKDTIRVRWDYHSKTIDLIKSLGISDPKMILEMGTMGISCVNDSDTIDFMEKWNFPGKQPSIVHDCRQTPWPIANSKYELFISLRAFQHLIPYQKEAFQEALRIARKVIIVVPREYDNPIIPDSKGITYQDFVKYNDGIHPNMFLPTEFGDLYFWNQDSPSLLNIESYFKDLNSQKIIYEKKIVKEYIGVLKLLSILKNKIIKKIN